MFRSGQFVASQIESVSDEQIQPNGVDLTLGDVLEQTEPGRVGVDGKTVGAREPVDADADVFDLDRGGYILQYAETISVPEDHVGFLYPRSTLMRNSCMLNTAVWDAGYEGRGEGLLQVHHPIRLERGARVAQLVLAEASHDDVYDGTYQGERTDR
ncbi:deoxyuridine 5'-triphosphate nucleotidohydrolase [Halobellus limi]|jgi:dUTP pyrophosphatase|uniref:Deoxyuridine 5'-triphosphate nucleotidohydrolase n=1 Tax=Halobellus limi TaxID=699433 RepID=A0A1H5VTI3_9EURY|nr:deoxyuridine 5'-triphosphate nucleotidohydrolase [Halobellus limi]QCC46632.1 deoxyuridine 5'-triphosphate nucleotidohydrolase [Halobellus limi]SEF90151.1 dUTP pyrophosphatase [Halobellus limi]